MPIPRIVMAMAKDGLLFRCLANVHPRFKTPFTATCLTGLIAAIAAMVTDLDSLVDMMSIGTNMLNRLSYSNQKFCSTK